MSLWGKIGIAEPNPIISNPPTLTHPPPSSPQVSQLFRELIAFMADDLDQIVLRSCASGLERKSDVCKPDLFLRNKLHSHDLIRLESSGPARCSPAFIACSDPPAFRQT